MIDTYIQSDDETALQDFCAPQANVIGPVKGSDATFDENGVLLAPARGNAKTWYACIRRPESLTPAPPITQCPIELGIEVAGTWA